MQFLGDLMESARWSASSFCYGEKGGNKTFEIPGVITKLKLSVVKFVPSKAVVLREGFKVSNHFEVSKFPKYCKVNYIQTCDYGFFYAPSAFTLLEAKPVKSRLLLD